MLTSAADLSDLATIELTELAAILRSPSSDCTTLPLYSPTDALRDLSDVDEMQGIDETVRELWNKKERSEVEKIEIGKNVKGKGEKQKEMVNTKEGVHKNEEKTEVEGNDDLTEMPVIEETVREMGKKKEKGEVEKIEVRKEPEREKEKEMSDTKKGMHENEGRTERNEDWDERQVIEQTVREVREERRVVENIEVRNDPEREEEREKEMPDTKEGMHEKRLELESKTEENQTREMGGARKTDEEEKEQREKDVMNRWCDTNTRKKKKKKSKGGEEKNGN